MSSYDLPPATRAIQGTKPQQNFSSAISDSTVESTESFLGSTSGLPYPRVGTSTLGNLKASRIRSRLSVDMQLRYHHVHPMVTGTPKGIALVLITAVLFRGVKGERLKENYGIRKPAELLTGLPEAVQVAQWQEPVGDLRDPGILLLAFFNQINVANVNDLFPVRPFIRLTPSLNFYRLTACPRKDIGKCLYHGDDPP
jgi:hypothetical protein